ncbi:auxin-induced protein 15A [Canna indica]|uniref:Auxin-induced protein 15A n=1 Tax=Canna indica TaxID=4628 RepID=A0AAQ3QIQ1_9LILI|nr:auxin-induced protein 15A [Canna indica]
MAEAGLQGEEEEEEQGLLCGVRQGRKKKFVVPLEYLDHPIFQVLLEMAEEEKYRPSLPRGFLFIPVSCGHYVEFLILIGNKN